MKVGDFVSYKVESWMGPAAPSAIGVVTWWDGGGKYKVLWANHSVPVVYDDWELVPHVSR